MSGMMVVRPAWKSHSVLYVKLPKARKLAPLRDNIKSVMRYLEGHSEKKITKKETAE